MNEAQYQQRVIQWARLQGWTYFHLHRTRMPSGSWRTAGAGDVAGWPDLFAVRDHRAIAVEFKTEKGRLSLAQRGWLERLRAAGIETHVWRPSDWDLAERSLRK